MEDSHEHDRRGFNDWRNQPSRNSTAITRPSRRAASSGIGHGSNARRVELGRMDWRAWSGVGSDDRDLRWNVASLSGDPGLRVEA